MVPTGDANYFVLHEMVDRNLVGTSLIVTIRLVRRSFMPSGDDQT